MSNVKNFADRSREFEQAHHSCRELLQGQMEKIEQYTTKWILAAIAFVVLLQAAGFTYFYFELINLRKRVDHRYFLTKESLEDIHKLRLENGRVIREYTKD